MNPFLIKFLYKILELFFWNYFLQAFSKLKFEYDCIQNLHAFTSCMIFIVSAKLCSISLKHPRWESIMLAWVQWTRYKYGSRQMQTKMVVVLRLSCLSSPFTSYFFVLVTCLLTTRFYIALVLLFCFSCLSLNDAFLHYTCFIFFFLLVDATLFLIFAKLPIHLFI